LRRRAPRDLDGGGPGWPTRPPATGEPPKPRTRCTARPDHDRQPGPPASRGRAGREPARRRPGRADIAGDGLRSGPAWRHSTGGQVGQLGQAARRWWARPALPGRPAVITGPHAREPPSQPHQLKGSSSGILMRRPVILSGRTRTYRVFSPGAQGYRGRARGRARWAGSVTSARVPRMTTLQPVRVASSTASTSKATDSRSVAASSLDPGSVRNTTRSWSKT